MATVFNLLHAEATLTRVEFEILLGASSKDLVKTSDQFIFTLGPYYEIVDVNLHDFVNEIRKHFHTHRALE
jgi:hypothetical protein